MRRHENACRSTLQRAWWMHLLLHEHHWPWGHWAAAMHRQTFREERDCQAGLSMEKRKGKILPFPVAGKYFWEFGEKSPRGETEVGADSHPISDWRGSRINSQ